MAKEPAKAIIGSGNRALGDGPAAVVRISSYYTAEVPNIQQTYGRDPSIATMLRTRPSAHFPTPLHLSLLTSQVDLTFPSHASPLPAKHTPKNSLSNRKARIQHAQLSSLWDNISWKRLSTSRPKSSSWGTATSCNGRRKFFPAPAALFLLQDPAAPLMFRILLRYSPPHCTYPM